MIFIKKIWGKNWQFLKPKAQQFLRNIKNTINVDFR
jgi:hypothetical protein